MRLLVTRPQPEAERSAALLRRRGHTALVAPLLRLQRLEHEPVAARQWAGVLATSANALRALDDVELAALRPIPLLAVGDRTAEFARACGFAQVASASGNASALVAQAARDWTKSDAPLIYLAAEDRAADISDALAMFGVTVHTVVIYRMAAEASFPAPVREALAAEAIDAVLHYSGRSAEVFLACARAANLLTGALAPPHLCLSPEIAARLLAAGASQTSAAAEPNEAALLRLIDAGASSSR
jgi:uroporphyrinogen-III synthase